MVNQSPTQNERISFGQWEFCYSSFELTNSHTKQVNQLEPKIGQLLHMLLLHQQSLVTKEQLITQLWQGVVVSEDALPKAISRLRAALHDTPSTPQFIKTIPKRGYKFIHQIDLPDSTKQKPKASRLIIATVVATLFLVSLSILLLFSYPFKEQSKNAVSDQHNEQHNIDDSLERAEGLYMQFDEQSNEAAIALYESVLETDSENSRAQAGLVNAMVQRAIRWPSQPSHSDNNSPSVSNALASGQLESADTKLMLERARLLAEKSVRKNPSSTQALKSLGLVYSVEGKIDEAIAQYKKAISLDEHAWRSMVNLGEMYSLKGQSEQALRTFIQAYNAMQARFQVEPQFIGPWQPDLGIVITQLFYNKGDLDNAIQWANNVLTLEPFQREASTILIQSLIKQGEHAQATQVCTQYAVKLLPLEVCQVFE